VARLGYLVLAQYAHGLVSVHGLAQRRTYTGMPSRGTRLGKNLAMSMGIRTQPCETGCSGTSVSPWMA
jgi:hypothetical protein